MKRFSAIFHPVAARLLAKCDAVLRVGGPSVGADAMVRVGREPRLEIYAHMEEIPGCVAKKVRYSVNTSPVVKMPDVDRSAVKAKAR